jgi:hypothetical protein
LAVCGSDDVSETDPNVVVVADGVGNYYLFEPAVFERARVPAERLAELQLLLDEAQVQGYGSSSLDIPATATPQYSGLDIPANATPKNTLVTISASAVPVSPVPMVTMLPLSPSRLFSLLH